MAATVATTTAPTERVFPPLRRRPLPLGEAGPPSGELLAGPLGLRVLHEGGGPVVLFAGGRAEDWDAQPFVRAGYRVVRYDERPASDEAKVGDLAADAVDVLDAVGARTAHLVGRPDTLLRVAASSPDRVQSLALVGEGVDDDTAAPTLRLRGDEEPEVFAALVAGHLYLSR